MQLEEGEVGTPSHGSLLTDIHLIQYPFFVFHHLRGGILVPSSLPVMVAQPDERLSSRTQKRVLCIGVVRQTQSSWLIRDYDALAILPATLIPDIFCHPFVFFQGIAMRTRVRHIDLESYFEMCRIHVAWQLPITMATANQHATR